MAEKWNVTSTAVKIGVSRQRIYQILKTDENFKKAFDAVKEAWLDKSEEVILDFAARGANITANIFALKTHRDEWKEKVDLDVTHEIDLTNALEQLKNMLDKPWPKPVKPELSIVRSRKSN